MPPSICRPSFSFWLTIIIAVASVSACSKSKEPAAQQKPQQPDEPQAATDETPDEIPTSESERLKQFFTEVFWRTVRRSPFIQGYLGFEFDKDKWDDLSEARALDDVKLARSDLARLRSEFDVAALDEQSKLSHRLFERRLLEAIDDYEWRHHSFPINQMFGLHSQIPTFLSNFHGIDNLEDAEAYIARLRALPALFKQLEESLTIKEKRGVLPPKFVFPMAIDDCKNIIKGAPFDESGDESGKDSPILADFTKKLDELDKPLAPDVDQRLRQQVRDALLTAVRPAYESLMATLTRQEALATTDDGVWRLPRGGEYYKRKLAITTTLEMTAPDIHALGLREVERIHGEMRALMKQVKFAGSLPEFFEFMRTDKQFYFADDDAGRAAYLDLAKAHIKAMEARLDEVFITKPKAGIEVKRVEKYREDSAGLAFYFPPGLIGGRLGVYYVNLFDMSALPKYEMEALAFHEGIPGHHMQHTIASEQEGLPMFRRFLGYTAYGEGWGLYSERLAKEMGFYKDPYSDFGRLSMELWRACRLVIDTGIHHEKWTRERAIKWLGENTPGSPRDVRKAVERYIVMPGQATAYTIGMLEILRLRAHARERLGERFDLRAFHEVVLTNGSVPLPVLGEQVEQWIARGGAVLH